MKKLSHVDRQGRPRMVDVSAKPESHRLARATGLIRLQASTLRLIARNQIQKGNVLGIAELAGIQAAKQTWQLIPLCHQLRLSKVHVQAELGSKGVRITSEVVCTERTGVEMEALLATTTALLTIYDMCKAVDRRMIIESVRLIEKTKSAPGAPDPADRPRARRLAR
jgi:cyclic pyranopterin phosphate synthase